MPTMETRRRIAELKMRRSALDVQEKTLRHQLLVTTYAIAAFSEGEPRTAKVSLGPSQSKRVRDGAATIKRLLPKQLRVVTDAAEELSKNAYIPIPFLPLLVRMNADLEHDLAAMLIEITGVQQDIDALSRQG